MVEACNKARVVMATNHHLRNAPTHLKIKELIKEGVLGKILAVRVFHAAYLPERLHGWRLDSEKAGGGVIMDIKVHDADTLRFHLEQDPTQIVAMKQYGGMSQNQIEDGAMCLLKFPSGTIAQTHEAFTSQYAGTGIEFHGTRGSIRARNVMTQEPIGEITLITEKGEEIVNFTPHNLYERAVMLFTKAVQGKGVPAADGIDGIKSLAIALAAKKSASTGQAIQIDYGSY